MKRVAQFVKTTALGGFLVLLPVAVLYVMLARMFELLVSIATPIAGVLPESVVNYIRAPILIVAVLILTASFCVGLAMRSTVGNRLLSRIESTIHRRVPGYAVLKSLAARPGNIEGAGLAPAMMTLTTSIRALVLVVEDHGDGEMTVFLPSSPAVVSGTVQITNKDKIQFLDANLRNVMDALGHRGTGVRKLLGSGDAAHRGLVESGGSILGLFILLGFSIDPNQYVSVLEIR